MHPVIVALVKHMQVFELELKLEASQSLRLDSVAAQSSDAGYD
jgi:hypothetical protein